MCTLTYKNVKYYLHYVVEKEGVREMKITDKYVLFWGGPFSNWWEQNFTVDDNVFNCSEQFFMYKKAIYFCDYKTANDILKANKPKDQKDLGRLVKNYNEDEWNEVRYEIMKEVVYQKFKRNSNLRRKLLDTGDRIIVEASPKDIIWGIGWYEDDPEALDESKWRGQNLLGKALMEVREMLRRNL